MLKHFKLTIILSLFLLVPLGAAYAHCDGLDGPVIKAAKKALESEDINLILIWVFPKDEPEIKEAFEKSLAVRKSGVPEAKELADRYFFETIVRVHRAGEGASYTGLKPAGRNLGPAIPAADKAIENGSSKEVLNLITDAARKGLEERLADLRKKKDFKKGDVEAGREYVEAYVSYLHYVERLYDAANNPAKGLHREHEEE